jgi:transposase-like protein
VPAATIRAIRAAVMAGQSVAAICRQFSVSPKYIRDLRSQALRRLDAVEIPKEVAVLPEDEVEAYRVFATIGMALESAAAKAKASGKAR